MDLTVSTKPVKQTDLDYNRLLAIMQAHLNDEAGATVVVSYPLERVRLTDKLLLELQLKCKGWEIRRSAAIDGKELIITNPEQLQQELRVAGQLVEPRTFVAISAGGEKLAGLWLERENRFAAVRAEFEPELERLGFRGLGRRKQDLCSAEPAVAEPAPSLAKESFKFGGTLRSRRLRFLRSAVHRFSGVH